MLHKSNGVKLWLDQLREEDQMEVLLIMKNGIYGSIDIAGDKPSI